MRALASAGITRTKHANNDLSSKRTGTEALLYPSNADDLCGYCNAELCRSVASEIVLQSGTPGWKWLDPPKDWLGDTETDAWGTVPSCSILMDLLCWFVRFYDSYSLSWTPICPFGCWILVRFWEKAGNCCWSNLLLCSDVWKCRWIGIA